jgi:hypothetical protein
MGCLSPSQIAGIKAEISILDEQITAAQAAYLSSLGNAEIETYRFDSGDGSQRADRRNPATIRKEIEALKSSRARLSRELNGTSNVNMNLRRRGGEFNGRYYR